MSGYRVRLVPGRVFVTGVNSVHEASKLVKNHLLSTQGFISNFSLEEASPDFSRPWGKGNWTILDPSKEAKKMNETEETKENAELRPEGNLGAVNRVGGEQG